MVSRWGRENRTVDSPVAVLVGLTNHLVNFVVCKLLADRGHDVTQLSRGDESVVVAVEDLVIMSGDRRVSMVVGQSNG